MDVDDVRTIGWRLRRVRGERGKSLRVIAGLGKATLSRIECGERSPTLNEWLRQRATAQGRSMSAETVAILRAALQGTQSGAGRSQAIDRLRTIRQRAHLGAGARPAEELIRADRERSG